jgi:hypothetical protein
MVSPSDFLSAIHRVKACYSEDPGLAVPVADLARLSGVPLEACSAAVSVLDVEGVLQRRRHGRWGLAADIESVRRR